MLSSDSNSRSTFCFSHQIHIPCCQKAHFANPFKPKSISWPLCLRKSSTLPTHDISSTSSSIVLARSTISLPHGYEPLKKLPSLSAHHTNSSSITYSLSSALTSISDSSHISASKPDCHAKNLQPNAVQETSFSQLSNTTPRTPNRVHTHLPISTLRSPCPNPLNSDSIHHAQNISEAFTLHSHAVRHRRENRPSNHLSSTKLRHYSPKQAFIPNMKSIPNNKIDHLPPKPDLTEDHDKSSSFQLDELHELLSNSFKSKRKTREEKIRFRKLRDLSRNNASPSSIFTSSSRKSSLFESVRTPAIHAAHTVSLLERNRPAEYLIARMRRQKPDTQCPTVQRRTKSSNSLELCRETSSVSSSSSANTLASSSSCSTSRTSSPKTVKFGFSKLTPIFTESHQSLPASVNVSSPLTTPISNATSSDLLTHQFNRLPTPSSVPPNIQSVKITPPIHRQTYSPDSYSHTFTQTTNGRYSLNDILRKSRYSDESRLPSSGDTNAWANGTVKQSGSGGSTSLSPSSNVQVTASSASSTFNGASKLELLERENRLLEAALMAVLRTGGMLNGCPCSYQSNDQVNRPLLTAHHNVEKTTLSTSQSGNALYTADTIEINPSVSANSSETSTYETSGRRTLNLYLKTRGFVTN